MTGFLLSPGITPTITDIFVVEMPIALGLAYLFGGRRGFEAAFLANLFALAAVKLWTDFADLGDDSLTVAALAVGLLWTVRLGRVGDRSMCPGVGVRVVGVVAIALGIFKIATDPFDPFDILLADAAIVAGASIWVAVAGRAPPAGPRPGPAAL